METTQDRKTTKADGVFADLTAAVIEAIENDPGDWTRPWRETAEHGLPHNARTGRPYSGGNVWVLLFSAAVKGYPANTWATYRQWGDLGAQVRKGERATAALLWQQRDRKVVDPDTGEPVIDPDTGEQETERYVFAKGISLFNVAQVDGYVEPDPDPDLTTPSGPEAIEAAEAWFAAIGAKVITGGNRAFYRPGLADFIGIPNLDQFETAEAFYATLAHEHVHWTGHPARCDRDLSGRFGDDAYAAEELVAELGSVFVGFTLGIEVTPRLDHAQYLAHWLRVLRDDARALWATLAKAQAAHDWLAEAAS